ncbi:MAG: hypothetical protein LBI28_01950 [Treponema sp.]|jgi:sialate O-acetylesterase|nr:hypothetical protein [Treponema sp.]
MNDLNLSPFISSGMIIQREANFPVWSSKETTVSFLGKTYNSQNVDGKWLVTLEPAKAGGPFEMEIVCDNSSVKIADIYIGDVWLCSGQSNMEMAMNRLQDDFPEEWKLKDFPLIRQFKVNQEWDFSAPREELSGGCWLRASAETLHEFSGTAWFFAKKLYEKYRIPIGLVNTAWGGTPVEAWMSEDALSSFPGKIAEGRQYADTAKREEITNTTNSAIQKWEEELKTNDTGLAESWQNPQTDISSWNDIKLPDDFASTGLSNFCGVIWLAKEFKASSSFASKNSKLWLGTITDADTVYVNGVETGNTGYRYPPRKYIPAEIIVKGKNRIVIRVTCNNGEGGVTKGKPFCIFTDNESVKLSGVWKYKTGAICSARPPEFFFQRHPMGNYNAMIAPVLKFPFKGVIWYQGESNDSDPNDYAQLFKLMIQDWRKKNKNEVLPFLFVQLPIWKLPSDNDEKSSWAIIREAQKDALALPATGMATALDLGEWNDLHPLNKKDVAYRLFLTAEKTLFGVNNSSPGPTLSSFQLQKNNILLYFENCGMGLTIKAPLYSLKICEPTEPNSNVYVSVTTDDGQVRLPAKIKGKNVISVDISAIKGAKKLLYAWADNPRDRQLFNKDGLPALPFKIELNKGETNV